MKNSVSRGRLGQKRTEKPTSSHSSVSGRSTISVETAKAVKFPGKEVIPADTDADNSYYTFSTT